jgi:hypothetical protein
MDESREEEELGPASAPLPSEEGDDTIARINLRMPEHLKARVERAADAEGLSVNAWLVRAAAAQVDRKEGTHRRVQRVSFGAQRYQGWAR